MCARAQEPGGANKIIERLEKDGGCVTLQSGVKVCRADFSVDGRAVEAITFAPAGNGPFPGVLLIPGYDRTARDYLPTGVRMAREGFAGVAVSQPGFGRSQGPPDFVGPKTLAVLTTAYRRLQKESYVDPNRMAIYGYSRGGMAASLLAVQLDDLKAAVFGAGVYDFQRAYDDVRLPGIRENMRAETGMTPEAVRERSSIFMMERLKCPVLILHGEKDKNVPVNQAKMLRDRLTQLHKDFEIKLFPDKEHSIGPEAADMAIDFFQRRLMVKAAQSGG
jgi:dipeptidyl aminopeptidase/acylaminoacyl peptidase